MHTRRYGSDLTDAQWEAIAPLFEQLRLHKHHPRTVLDALFYVVKGGNQWRQLPDSFPSWQSVYYHFGRWMRTGLLDRVHALLRRLTRIRAGPTPSAAVIDAQSVKTSSQGGVRGFDGGKLVKGRKRHILVDTLGMIWAVLVHSAGTHDSQRAPHLLDRVQGLVPRLEIIFADQGYLGTPPGRLARVRVALARRPSGASSEGVCPLGEAVDRRADVRVVRGLPSAGEGLRAAVLNE